MSMLDPVFAASQPTGPPLHDTQQLTVLHLAAMLTVEDPAFWEGVEPVKFGVLPRLQDSVTVIG